MTNPLPYIRNKFCVWLTGLSLDEIQSLKDRCDELTQDNDWISKSDFDPDDYDFSPLNDYDFSEFLTTEGIDDQIQCYLDNACDFVDKDTLEEEYVKFDAYEEVINSLRNRITELESKGKKKKKKDTKPKE